MIRLSAGAASLVGQVRTANEDSVLVTQDLVVVADGMGGHLAGEVASADAVEVVGGAAGRRSLVELVSSVHLANRRINDRAAEDEELHGMGTTVCAVGVVDEDGEHLAVLNVGDSRVYLLAGGILTRLTEDHSLVETLVREGRITAADAEVHPQRNVLTRALGVEALVVVDAWLLEPCDGDRLLLCSDGLFNELTEERIAQLLAEGADPETTAQRLAAEADEAGGRDNITTVVVDVFDTDRPAEPIDGRYRRIATPAIDLDDLHRDPSSDTATVPMVPVAPAPEDRDEDPDGDLDEPADDLEGEEYEGSVEDGAALDATGDTDTDPAIADGGAPPSGADEPPSRSSWRTPLFLLSVLVVLGLAAGIVVYYSGRGYFLGPEGEHVAVYRGRAESFLWFDPQVVRSSDLPLEDLRPNERASIERRRWSFEDREAADARLERLIDSTTTTTTSTTTTTTTPTTTSTTTTTTAPANPGAQPTPP